jgi:uncharacterized protein
VRAAAALGAAAALTLSYMAFEAQWLRRREYAVDVPGLDPLLDGFTVVHLSDLHAGSGPSLNLRSLRKAIAVARAAAPDLVVITGDFVTGPSRLDDLKNELRRLTARHGVFGVLGNHDHGFVKLVKAPAVDLTCLDEAGVRLLTNECVTIAVETAAVQVCGIDDLRHGYGDLGAVGAALDRRPGVLRLLLSHYGEVVERCAPGDFALVLAGDTHGGQICLPWVGGPIMLSDPRARYRAGFYESGRGRSFVTAGVGTSFLPLRLLCRPEVVVFRFGSV